MRSSAWLAGAFLVPLTLSAVEDITGQTPVNTGARQIAVIVKDDRQAVYRIPEQPKEPEKPKEDNQTEKPAEKSIEKPTERKRPPGISDADWARLNSPQTTTSNVSPPRRINSIRGPLASRSR